MSGVCGFGDKIGSDIVNEDAPQRARMGKSLDVGATSDQTGNKGLMKRFTWIVNAKHGL